MARIPPVDETSAPVASRELAAEHAAAGGRMTNMKWTLAHSPVALDALLQWYPLRDAIAAAARRAPAVALLPRDLDPERLPDLLDVLPAAADRRRRGSRQGRAGRVRRDDRGPRAASGSDPHSVDDALHARLAAQLSDAEIVSLIAFGAMMVATNVFNDALARRPRRLSHRRTPLDDRALITGAAHGQGRATALALARDGYDIVALGRRPPPCATRRIRWGRRRSSTRCASRSRRSAGSA